jgi:hypothetical protein
LRHPEMANSAWRIHSGVHRLPGDLLNVACRAILVDQSRMLRRPCATCSPQEGAGNHQENSTAVCIGTHDRRVIVGKPRCPISNENELRSSKSTPSRPSVVCLSTWGSRDNRRQVIPVTPVCGPAHKPASLLFCGVQPFSTFNTRPD